VKSANYEVPKGNSLFVTVEYTDIEIHNP